MSYQCAIDAVSDRCFPSYALRRRAKAAGTLAQFELLLVAAVLAEGWAVSLPDHGGPKGVFGAPVEPGYCVLDGLRAALNFAPLNLSTSDPVGGVATEIMNRSRRACRQRDDQTGVPCALHQSIHVYVHGRVELGTGHQISYVTQHLLGDDFVYSANPADEASTEADRINGCTDMLFAHLFERNSHRAGVVETQPKSYLDLNFAAIADDLSR